MTTRPILFSGAMVRALLDGRKTQTRRALKEQPPESHRLVGIYAPHLTAVFNPAGRDHQGDPDADIAVRLPYAVGDLLWVREAFIGTRGYDGAPPSKWGNKPIWCIADGDPDREAWWHLSEHARPSIHMPRWASRLTLRVTAGRVQRVQDITEADAIAEGLLPQQGTPGPGSGYKWRGTGYHAGTMDKQWGPCFHTPRHDGLPGCSCKVAGPSPAQCAFRELWDSLNAKRGLGWDANPWVTAATFTVHLSNVDDLAHGRAA